MKAIIGAWGVGRRIRRHRLEADLEIDNGAKSRAGLAITLHGEVGTGKRLLAQYLHSIQGTGPIKPLTFPDASFNLAESPLFGSRYGALVLPPLRRGENCLLDFTPFLLYDRIYMDKSSLNGLISYLSLSQLHKKHIEEIERLFDDLERSGWLRTIDYEQQFYLHPGFTEILNKMTEADHIDSQIWPILEESANIWIDFVKSTSKPGFDPSPIPRHSPNSTFWRDYLSDCLYDINAILLIRSSIHAIAIHDWEDYEPFYKYKFLRAGRQMEEERTASGIERMIRVFVPSFVVRSVDDIAGIRKDRRFQELRKLIEDGSIKPEEWDYERARDVLIDVALASSDVDRSSKPQSLVWWLSQPLSWIPSVGSTIRDIALKIFGKADEHRVGKYSRWPFFFVDLRKKYSTMSEATRLLKKSIPRTILS